MEIIPFGDHAILINFNQEIDLNINNQVINLAATIKTAQLKGFQYCIPAYCSLTVVYDPLTTNLNSLKIEIENLNLTTQTGNELSQRTLNIPVCYGSSYGLDLESFAMEKEKSIEEIISIHTSQVYNIYMLGFLPGFAYMGKLPRSLAANRLSSPRLKVPARSVGLAGLQTAVYPVESPGGWQLIGRTPIEVFDTISDDPFLFRAGDRVQFYAISDNDYEELRAEVLNHSFDINSTLDVGE